MQNDSPHLLIKTLMPPAAAPDRAKNGAPKKTAMRSINVPQPPVLKGSNAAAVAKPSRAWRPAQVVPAAKPCSSGDKARDKAAIETLAAELDVLQNMFYADKRFKLLVVLQGTDTSGKDGTLRGVFGRMSPLGV